MYQRVAIVTFTLFNWITTDGRNRFFPRRTDMANLQNARPAPPPPHTLLPYHATRGQIYDLIPVSKERQLGSRCQRPHSALSAAVVNRARRGLADARLEGDYTTAPLRFHTANPRVPLGTRSVADDPAPGAGRAAHTRCVLPPSDTPSALGDPGDWYCDFCGLCNWTRRTFCLRCCPLDTENVCE